MKALGSIRRVRKIPSVAVITQFMTGTLPLLWLAALLQAKPILVVHHNFEQAKRKRLLRAMLALTIRFGFTFLVFESRSALLDPRLRILRHAHCIELPELGPNEALWSELSHRPTRIPVVSVVGYERSEKRTQEIIDLLVECAPRLNFNLVVGSDRPAELKVPPGVEIRDTGRIEDYVDTLADSDIVVLANDPARYEHRSSGVLTDAIISGALVLGPYCEVFAHQINTPAVAGATYANDSEIETRLRELLAVPGTVRLEAIAAHREHRSPSQVAKQLDQQLDSLGL